MRAAFDAMDRSHPGCTWPAPTGSRTAAASARRRPPSSAASCWPEAWCEGGADLLDDGAVALAGEPARGPPRQRRPCPARRVRDQRPGRRRGVGAAGSGRPVGLRGGVRAAGRRTHRGRAWPAARDRAATPTRPPTAAVRHCWSRRSAGSPAQLLRATEDFLHQQQREPAMPESLALVGELRVARHSGGGLGGRTHRAGLRDRRRARAWSALGPPDGGRCRSESVGPEPPC